MRRLNAVPRPELRDNAQQMERFNAMQRLGEKRIPNPMIVERPYAARLGESLLYYARTYVERYGISVVPVVGKLPTIKWKEFQTRVPTTDELHGWQWDGLAIVTGEVSKLVVVDCESLEDARWFYTTFGKSPSLVRTRRGVHLYFQHPGWRVKNHTHVRGKYDIRGDGGLAIAPPSPNRQWLDGHTLLHQVDLPLFRAEWLPDKEGHAAARAAGSKDISCPEAYIATIRAVSGQAGHDATYKAASYLRDAGVAKFEAAMILARWNLTNAEPSWSDTDLAHKLDDVFG
jgi:hypothetical protein